MPDPSERVAAGFVPSAIQVGPDGAPAPIPVAPLPERELVTLCQLGPCVRYHELRTKLDAQDPQDGSERHVYVSTTRTCYPSPGIEMDLSETPVRDCNLWEPRIDVAETRLRHRQAYQRTKEGAEQWAEYEASWAKK